MVWYFEFFVIGDAHYLVVYCCLLWVFCCLRCVLFWIGLLFGFAVFFALLSVCLIVQVGVCVNSVGVLID